MTPADYWSLLDAAAMLEHQEQTLRSLYNDPGNPIAERERSKLTDMAKRLREIAAKEKRR